MELEKIRRSPPRGGDVEVGGGVKIRRCPPRGGGMGTLLDAVGRFCEE